MRVLRGMRDGVGEGVPQEVSWACAEGQLLVLLLWIQVLAAVGVSVVHVLGVGAGVGESFAALVTLVRLLPRVQAAVLDQMVLMFKGLVADLALVGALA